MAVGRDGHRPGELSVTLIVQCNKGPYLRLRRRRGRQSCHFGRRGPELARYPACQPGEEMTTMKKLILAAFAALSLTAGIAPMAHAYTNIYHSGPYDNTGNGPGETGQEGGGG